MKNVCKLSKFDERNSKISDEFHYNFSSLIDLPKRDKMGSLMNYLTPSEEKNETNFYYKSNVFINDFSKSFFSLSKRCFLCFFFD